MLKNGEKGTITIFEREHYLINLGYGIGNLPKGKK
jgi:hypothetical protein